MGEIKKYENAYLTPCYHLVSRRVNKTVAILDLISSSIRKDPSQYHPPIIWRIYREDGTFKTVSELMKDYKLVICQENLNEEQKLEITDFYDTLLWYCYHKNKFV